MNQEEQAVYATKDAAEATLYRLAVETSPHATEAPVVKRFYRQWCKDHGVAADQIRTQHSEFLSGLKRSKQGRAGYDRGVVRTRRSISETTRCTCQKLRPD